MSSTMTMASPARPSPRLPHQVDSSIDAVDRHDYGGVQKARKYSSAGGGRAWTEDEVHNSRTTGCPW